MGVLSPLWVIIYVLLHPYQFTDNCREVYEPYYLREWQSFFGSSIDCERRVYAANATHGEVPRLIPNQREAETGEIVIKQSCRGNPEVEAWGPDYGTVRNIDN